MNQNTIVTCRVGGQHDRGVHLTWLDIPDLAGQVSSEETRSNQNQLTLNEPCGKYRFQANGCPQPVDTRAWQMHAVHLGKPARREANGSLLPSLMTPSLTIPAEKSILGNEISNGGQQLSVLSGWSRDKLPRGNHARAVGRSRHCCFVRVFARRLRQYACQRHGVVARCLRQSACQRHGILHVRGRLAELVDPMSGQFVTSEFSDQLERAFQTHAGLRALRPAAVQFVDRFVGQVEFLEEQTRCGDAIEVFPMLVDSTHKEAVRVLCLFQRGAQVARLLEFLERIVERNRLCPESAALEALCGFERPAHFLFV